MKSIPKRFNDLDSHYIHAKYAIYTKLIKHFAKQERSHSKLLTQFMYPINFAKRP